MKKESLRKNLLITDSISFQFGEWPHVCYLQRFHKNSGVKVFLSGASLIAPGVILTAAHWVA